MTTPVHRPDQRGEPADYSPPKQQIDEADRDIETVLAAGRNEERSEIGNQQQGPQDEEPFAQAGKLRSEGLGHAVA